VKLILPFLAALAASPAVHSSRAAESFLKPNDVIALVGGEDMVAAGEYGNLELQLHRALPDFRLKVRGLAWEGDTVFEQPRMLNYPRLEQQLDEIGATVVIVQFGQMESLAGSAKLSSFIEGYASLLDRLKRSRVVIISPTMFEETRYQTPQFAATLRHNNVSLFEYSEHLESFAKQRGSRFVNATNPVSFLVLDGTEGKGGQRMPPLETVISRDGQHASKIGRAFIDASIAFVLGVQPKTKDSENLEDEALLELIRVKNRLWDRYRRPQNWAFLAGDRVTQPSSRDHRDPSKRWFPEEMKEFIPLIEAKEREIWALAAKLSKERN